MVSAKDLGVTGEKDDNVVEEARGKEGSEGAKFDSHRHRNENLH